MPAPAALVRFVFSSLLVLTASCGARAADEAPLKRQVERKAKEVIDEWSKYFAAARGFKYSSEVTIAFEREGEKASQSFSLKLAAQRPNKLAYAAEGAQGGATITSDGNELAVYIKGYPKYGVETAPATWEAMLQNPVVFGPIGLGNAVVVTGALLNSDPGAKLLEKTLTVKYGGLVDLDGAKCHLIAATGNELDWQLWIDAGNKPLVRQFLPDLSKAFAAMAKRSKGKSPFENVKISNTVTFKDWEIDPQFPADTFAFDPPEGIEKVDSLLAIITPGAAPSDPGPHPLVGQPAPPVKLELLDGGDLDLAGYKGKNVVILDFWATWCGPCTQAMPIIERVAGEYKDKGVLLFAVNMQEQPDDVKQFLEDSKLKVTVALDKDGAVGSAYKAEAIPQTVLVGKDGTVQVVRVGLSANLEAELTKDLDALVAGKDLATETLKVAKEKREAAAKAEKAKAAKADAESDKPSAGKAAAPAARKKPGLNISIEGTGGKKTEKKK